MLELPVTAPGRHKKPSVFLQRSIRPPPAHRAEETGRIGVVASWNAVPLKTDEALVLSARMLAWSWVTSSTLVRWPDSSHLPGRHPV